MASGQQGKAAPDAVAQHRRLKQRISADPVSAISHRCAQALCDQRFGTGNPHAAQMEPHKTYMHDGAPADQAATASAQSLPSTRARASNASCTPAHPAAIAAILGLAGAAWMYKDSDDSGAFFALPKLRLVLPRIFLQQRPVAPASLHLAIQLPCPHSLPSDIHLAIARQYSQDDVQGCPASTGAPAASFERSACQPYAC